jgi:hypothetical protein
LVVLLQKVFPKTLNTIINEELTEAIHPDFGWVWREKDKRGEG